jgi:drug/metabolite transporter (DMT)-like permease
MGQVTRTAMFTSAAMIAFAGNALLCRAALGPGLIDAASFTGVRLGAGAVALVSIALARGGRPREGSWASSLILVVYAITFSLAYLRIGASAGALILCGAIQITMIGWGIIRGERPSLAELGGLAMAVAGLVCLTLPGTRAVDLAGAALMAASGVTWGVYSLHGRRARLPLAANADNFLRSLPCAVLLVLGGLGSAHATSAGIWIAAISGALTTAIGYILWYAALPALTTTRAAIVQLATPVIAAAGAVLLLGEPLSARLLIAGALILGGVAVALSKTTRAAASSSHAGVQSRNASSAPRE